MRAQVALRSSLSIASSTATRVSTDPLIVDSLRPFRNNWRSRSWSWVAGSLESMKRSTVSTNRSGSRARNESAFLHPAA